MPVKRNPDYSESAVNLTNPEILETRLGELHTIQGKIRELQAEIEKCVPPSLLAPLKILTESEAAIKNDIRLKIDELGSYQDLETGSYAVKQKRASIDYSPAKVKINLPDNVAKMVIVEVVDEKKLAGMIKGGFITKEQAESCGDTSYTYAYIIK